MDRTVRLGLAGLTLFLLLFPLTLAKPGMPASLKADEAAYYLMAQSLARDGDLELRVEDVDRLFLEYPFQPANNLIVMTDDGWRSVFYGKPFVYSLAAAPFVRLFGANGLVCFNMALLCSMIWMGWAWLRRTNPDGLAALYSVGFFLLSTALPYAFWIQPEVFNMAGVAACLFWAMPRPASDRFPEPMPAAALAGGRRVLLLAALSGAALALAVYNKPMIGAVALAPLWVWLRGRRWREMAAWSAGAGVCLAVVAGVAVLLTGHPTSYLGVMRQGVTVCEPGVVPIAPAAVAAPAPAVATPPVQNAATPLPPIARPAAPASTSATGNSWSWLIRNPGLTWGEVFENVGYFLWGRHTGLILYLPFAVLSVLLFLLHGRRFVPGWILLGSLLAYGLFFLVFIAWNWQGGGGFVGNRYFINVYPGFLFLVTRIRPHWVVPAGFAVAGLTLAPMLFTPFGAGGPEPTLQSHTRNFPYRLFPLELSLRNVPGYERIHTGGLRVIGRKDLFLPYGEQWWLRAGGPAELHLVSDRPLERLTFEVRSGAPGNRVRLALGDAREALDFQAAGEAKRVVLVPGGSDRERSQQGTPLWVYRLVVTPENGRIRHWKREYAPTSCPYYAWNASTQESFFLGAALTYLGSGEGLGADVFALRWGQVVAPAQVPAGEPFTVLTRVFNQSRVPWTAAGSARVNLSYHWRDAAGREVVRDGERTPIELPVPPGGRVSVEQQVIAPAEPGRYTLELDPVFETVAWFSEKNGGNVHRLAVEVLPAGAAPVEEPRP